MRILFSLLIVFFSFGFSPSSSKMNDDNSSEPGSLYMDTNLEVSNFFPNPAIDYVKLDFKIKTTKEVNVVLFNVLGNPVKKYTLDRFSQSATYFIGDINSGTYFYQLSVEGSPLATKKLVIRN
ncbi:MAG: hypothetical protein RIR51_1951 [Bacteroidota bacterium]